MRQLVQEKENSEFKPVKLCLKIDLVSYPAWAEGLVNMITIILSKRWKNYELWSWCVLFVRTCGILVHHSSVINSSKKIVACSTQVFTTLIKCVVYLLSFGLGQWTDIIIIIIVGLIKSKYKDLTMRIDWKVHRGMSYLLLMTFFTNGIQVLQHQWKECVSHCKEDEISKNKPHLVTFHECILVSLWTFQLTHVFNETFMN